MRNNRLQVLLLARTHTLAARENTVSWTLLTRFSIRSFHVNVYFIVKPSNFVFCMPLIGGVPTDVF